MGGPCVNVKFFPLMPLHSLHLHLKKDLFLIGFNVCLQKLHYMKFL